MFVVSADKAAREVFEKGSQVFASLASASEVEVQADKAGIPEDAVSSVTGNVTVYMPFSDLVDTAKEIERLEKEEARLNKELARSRGMLGNEKFLSRAPEAKIREEKEKLEKYEQMMSQVQERLEALRK